MMHLAQSGDGRLILACSGTLTYDISRVEYYRDLKLFMMVYEDDNQDEDLMPHEISEDIAKIVVQSPDIIVAVKEDGEKPYGYVVPLVQIGL